MVEKISDELLKNIIDKSPMGLFYGRIGACIYLFHNNDSDAPNILKGACNSLNSINCSLIVKWEDEKKRRNRTIQINNTMKNTEGLPSGWGE